MFRKLAIGVAIFMAVNAAPAHAQTTDVVGAIHAAAQNHHVAAQPLLDLSRCESRFDPNAQGDYRWRGGRYVPTSRGPFQINDLPTGLYWHFLSVGYDDPMDPEQASDYVARVAKGEFRKDGVTLSRWSCWALVRR